MQVLNSIIQGFSLNHNRKRPLSYVVMLLYILSVCNAIPPARAIPTKRSVEHADSVNVLDFGAEPGSRENAVKSVQNALEHCRQLNNPVLVFPSGRYDFWPQHCIEKEYYESNTTDHNPKRLAILIDKFKNLTIDGKGSEFIFHDRMQPFTIDSSQDITVKNLRIDWDLPLSAEADVVDTCGTHIDLRLDPSENPYLLENGKLVFVGEGWKSGWWGTMEFERESRRIAYRTGDDGCLGQEWNAYRAEELSPGLLRLHHRFARRPGKGNYLVLRHSARDHAGIFILHSKNVSVENVDLYHCAGLGVLAQFSQNIILDTYRAIPNPQKNRILSGHDDGIQISNCSGLVTIQNCQFEALMDDPVNIHGTSVRVMERISADRLLCKFMHHQSIGMIWARAGDKVGFIENETMTTIGVGHISSFEAHNAELFEVIFTSPVPESVKPGDALENLTWSPEVVVRNNYFGSNRARGLLISTSARALVEGNTFASSGSAILIAGDANYWYESGAVSDVVIRNNVFLESCLTSMYQFCEAIISIYPEIPHPDPSQPPFHKNIRIENNEFHPFDYPVLYARSVDSLVFNKNRIIRSYTYRPFHHRKNTFTLEFCQNVWIKDNQFEGEVQGKNIFLIHMHRNELNIAPDQGVQVIVTPGDE